MATTKRERPEAETDEPEAKKAKKVSEAESSEPPRSQAKVVLNPADCDLDFSIEGNGLQGFALHERGFAYCWSGARANVGITGGKYCFGCKIVSAQPVVMEDTPLDQQHVCRVGISRGDDSVGNLGESEHSFGFGGTGRFSNAGKFLDYGEKFGVGDTIVCSVNLENKPLAFIGFSKNGKWLGTAKYFNAGPNGTSVVDSQSRKLQWESALFPHVLLKNVVVVLQFSREEGLVPEEGYKPWASALEYGNAIMGPTFSNPRDCEVMMLVGLPASGKSTWAEKWVKKHPEKRYVLLGTNLALDQMKVPGLLRKNNYGERFDRLMDRASGIFNTLLSRAAKTPRNYILDQTNVYKSARKRKLKPFADYQKIAVVVFPVAEELKARANKRFKEMGKEVPAEAVNEMLANYVLPTSKDMPGADEFFDQVIFTELNRGESQRQLDEMKRALASGANVHPKSVSPYSCESHVQSYNSLPMQNREMFSGFPRHDSASGGQWQSSYQPQPQLNYGYQSPCHVNSASFRGGSPGAIHSLSLTNQGNQIPPVRNDPYQTHGGYEHSRRDDIEVGNSIPAPRADIYPSRCLGGSHNCQNVESGNFISGGATGPYHSGMVEQPYVRPSLGKYGEYADIYQSYGLCGSHSQSNVGSGNVITGGATGPYQSGMAEPYARPSFSNCGEHADMDRSYGSSGSCSQSNVGSGNFIPGGVTGTYRSGMAEPYARPPFSNYGEHADMYRSSSGSHPELPGPGTSHPDLQSSRQSKFMSSPFNGHGSHYGTPVARPPYRDFPSDEQRPQGYTPTRPRYC